VLREDEGEALTEVRLHRRVDGPELRAAADGGVEAEVRLAAVDIDEVPRDLGGGAVRRRHLVPGDPAEARGRQDRAQILRARDLRRPPLLAATDDLGQALLKEE